MGDNCAHLVFMTTEGFLSKLIRFDEEGAVSHVCAVLDDGSAVSADLGVGVKRESAIDAMAGATMQITVDIQMTSEQYAAWHDYLERRVGEPFDLRGVIGIAMHMSLHTIGAAYCASLQVGALRHCQFFPRVLAQRFHLVSPVVLLLMLQARSLSSVIIHEPVTL